MGDSRPEECASTEARAQPEMEEKRCRMGFWAHKPMVPHRKRGVGYLERQTLVSTSTLSLAASHATGATDQEVDHGGVLG